MRFVTVFLSLLAFTVTAAAQTSAELLGKWRGTGPGVEGIEMVFEEGFVVSSGQRTPYSLPLPGQLVLGNPPEAAFTYQLRQDELTLRVPWGNVVLHRVVDPGVVEVARPAEPAKPAEPGDLFARTFTSEGVVLILQGTKKTGYTGQLALDEKLHSVEARLVGKRLRGSFGEGDDRTSFKATLENDELELSIDGKRYTLRGEPMLPPELEGMYAGEVHHFEHPRGYLGFDLPKGWSAGELGDEGMSFNLGLPPYGMPEAIAGLLWGLVPEEDQNRPVAQILEKYIPTLRTALKDEGLIIRKPDGPIKTYRGKDVPGAVARFEGRTTTGVDCVVWCGSMIKRNVYVTVSGVYAAEKEEKYLPKLKRVFATLEPRPPERNPELEALMVGKTFSSSQYGRVVEAAHHSSYTFAANNVVHRRLLSNIVSKPGLPGSVIDSESSGRYEVCGDILFMFFDTGQTVGQVMLEGKQVVGFRVGGAHYQ